MRTHMVGCGGNVKRLAAGLVLLLGGAGAYGQEPAAAARDPLHQLLSSQPQVRPGQSATQLPDGRWLLLGGEGDGANAAIVERTANTVTTLAARLHRARSGHSATLLPDGSVLVLGGVDARGDVIADAEQFDPDSGQFKFMGELGLIARSGHSATVLASGQLLITGGIDAQGHALAAAEFYDLVRRRPESFIARLDTTRMHHLAALLPGSDVLLWGGIDRDQAPIDGGEIYSFESERFTPVARHAAAALAQGFGAGSAPAIKSSQPAANSAGAPMAGPLMVHFTHRMQAATLGAHSVTLIGPDGAVPVRAVPVEYGMLLFVTPVQHLRPSTRYTLFIRGARNVAGRPLPPSAIDFETERGMQRRPDANQASAPKALRARGKKSKVTPARADEPSEGALPARCASGPVDCASGVFRHSSTDLLIQDVIPIKIERSYRSGNWDWNSFGTGTTLSYDIALSGDASPWTYQDLILPEGGQIRFERSSPGSDEANAVFSPIAGTASYHGATIRRRNNTCYWELLEKTGTRTCFPRSYMLDNPRNGAAVSISDRHGNTVTLTRELDGRLMRVVSPGGRYIHFIYGTYDHILGAVDSGGRAVAYDYDEIGRLIKATDAAGKYEVYTYDEYGGMLTLQDRRGGLTTTNEYDANLRLSKMTFADGSTNLFAYQVGPDDKVVQTDVTDERGIVTRMQFDGAGHVTALTQALGLPQQQVSTTVRDPVTGLITSHTDATGRTSAYTYDAKGNQLTHTVLAGTANALVVSSRSYTSDFSQLASVTDALGRTTTLHYNTKGDVIEVIDASGNHVTQSFSNAGQLQRRTDALGGQTVMEYAGHDLAKVTDPLNHSTRYFADNLGRPRSLVDPLGNVSAVAYDSMDRVTSKTDPASQSIAQGFDASGNLTSVTDPAGRLHQFAYNPRHATVDDTDPLNQHEAYVYDGKHNVIQKTDRKGQVTTYAYDALERLTSTTYADGGVVTVGYDGANRPVTVVDSHNGTLGFGYDLHDRIVMATTPAGSVAYTYHANGLRQSMTVAGQPTLTYGYDAANRLVRIDQAPGAANNNVARSVSFEYDAAGRRTGVTYMNGVTRQNSYDAAGRLTAITYKNPDGSTHGDLGYTYDDSGKRSTAGGSLARGMLPDAMPSASVDAANRLMTMGAHSFAYDDNGNLTGDGNQTYFWNARDQLIRIERGASVVATFAYDALGRRRSKTIEGVVTGFVHDAEGIVQELTVEGGHNYIHGGHGEMLVRQSGGGAGAHGISYLADALGSNVRLLDDAGVKLVDYTYDPYGSAHADAQVDNAFQHTGRENDGTGLYYVGSRYYAPQLARFISRDPTGLRGGINTYAYAQANPLSQGLPAGAEGSMGTGAANVGKVMCRSALLKARLWPVVPQTGMASGPLHTCPSTPWPSVF